MKYRIIFKLALKNLFSHKLRTILTVAGVTIGIASIIFLVSIGYGFEKLVTDQVTNFNAFTIVDVPSANISSIKIDQQSIDKISKFSNVASVQSVTNLAGRVHKQDSSSTIETVITGADQSYWDISSTTTEIGRMPSSNTEITVNESVVSLIGEKKDDLIGKNILLDIIIPAELRTKSAVGLKEVKDINLKIVGILKETTSPIVYVTKNLLIGHDATKFSSLKIKVDDQKTIPSLRKSLENIGFATEYVGDTLKEINQVFSLFRVILAAFGLIALTVAALGTFNTLTVSLLERIREVGLFKALGMKNKDVYKLFLAESLIIGLFGGILGLVIGWSTGQILNTILSYFAQKTQAEKISVFITPWFFALGITGFSVIVGFLTGWYPSKRAVKIDPLDALRYE